jgi:hypothetical protein
MEQTNKNQLDTFVGRTESLEHDRCFSVNVKKINHNFVGNKLELRKEEEKKKRNTRKKRRKKNPPQNRDQKMQPRSQFYTK